MQGQIRSEPHSFRLLRFQTGVKKPVGDFLGRPGAGLTEYAKIKIHQATELSNSSGAILAQRFPDCDHAAASQGTGDSRQGLRCGWVVGMMEPSSHKHRVV